MSSMALICVFCIRCLILTCSIGLASGATISADPLSASSVNHNPSKTGILDSNKIRNDLGSIAPLCQPQPVTRLGTASGHNQIAVSSLAVRMIIIVTKRATLVWSRNSLSQRASNSSMSRRRSIRMTSVSPVTA